MQCRQCQGCLCVVRAYLEYCVEIALLRPFLYDRPRQPLRFTCAFAVGLDVLWTGQVSDGVGQLEHAMEGFSSCPFRRAGRRGSMP
jgi:hypothetical protein